MDPWLLCLDLSGGTTCGPKEGKARATAQSLLLTPKLGAVISGGGGGVRGFPLSAPATQCIPDPQHPVISTAEGWGCSREVSLKALWGLLVG